MSKTKYPIFKCLRHGQKGFTLIELLIVIAILGIIAAVIVPNIGRFMGRGVLEAANIEAQNVGAAVMTAMYDNDVLELTDKGTVGPGRDSTVLDSDGVALAKPVTDYFSGALEATYTLDKYGNIDSAVPETDGKWKALFYYDGAWHAEAKAD